MYDGAANIYFMPNGGPKPKQNGQILASDPAKKALFVRKVIWVQEPVDHPGVQK